MAKESNQTILQGVEEVVQALLAYVESERDESASRHQVPKLESGMQSIATLTSSIAKMSHGELVQIIEQIGPRLDFGAFGILSKLVTPDYGPAPAGTATFAFLLNARSKTEFERNSKSLLEEANQDIRAGRTTHRFQILNVLHGASYNRKFVDGNINFLCASMDTEFCEKEKVDYLAELLRRASTELDRSFKSNEVRKKLISRRSKEAIMDFIIRASWSEYNKYLEALLDFMWSIAVDADYFLRISLLLTERRFRDYKEKTLENFKSDHRYEDIIEAQKKRRAGRDLELIASLLYDVDSRINESFAPNRFWKTLTIVEREAYRANLSKEIKGLKSKKFDAVESMLWWAGEKSSDDCISVAVSLCLSDSDRAQVKRLKGNFSKLVSLRATAVEHIEKGQEFAAPDIWLPRAIPIMVQKNTSVLREGRTWLGNPFIEQRIFGLFQSVEHEFASSFMSTYGQDEEALTESFFTKIVSRCRDLQTELDSLVARRVAPPFHVEMAYRPVPKREEGAPGKKAKRFSADIIVLVRFKSNDQLLATRVCLIQAKKQRKTTNGIWSKSFEIEKDQLAEINAESVFSYYLLYAAPGAWSGCILLPARLIQVLMAKEGSIASLSVDAATAAARTFADWMTYDVFGMWVGDDDSALAAKALSAANGRGAKRIFDIEITKIGDDPSSPKKQTRRERVS